MATSTGGVEVQFRLSGLEQTTTDMQSSMNRVGQSLTNVGKGMTMGITAPIVGLGVAAFNVGSEFEAQMSRVKAISGATGDQFVSLKDQALDLGASTAFSASEVALGMENMASAGFTTEEIMASMGGMLDLAASSGEDLATSADIASSTLRGFGLEAGEAAHVADVLAKNAADTNASVYDTGEAMKYVAPLAAAAGLSMEEVTAAIGVMANVGIQGSQAGTTLRGALSRLAKPSDAAAQTMERLGFNAYDSNGKMLSLSDMVGNLQTSLVGLTDQEKQNAIITIFGQEALSGMLALVDAGPEQLAALTEGLVNSDGAAANMASTMQDNAKSAVEQMGGALETVGIKIFEIVAPVISDIAGKIGEMADKFSALSPQTQTVIIVMAAIVAAIGPLLVIAGTLITSIGAVTGAIGGLGISMAMLTSPITITIAAIVALVAIIVYLWNTNEEFRTRVLEIWEVVKTQALAIFGAMQEFWAKWGDDIMAVFNRIWDTIKTVFNSALEIIGGLITFWAAIFAGDWSTAWESLKTIISSAWEGIKSVVQLIFDGILLIFTNLPEKLREIGANLLQSLWEGILSVKDMVIGNVTGLAGDILSGIKAKFGIASPSKEGLAIGENLATSMASGAEDNVGAIPEAFDGLGKSIANTANDITKAFATAWENVKSIWIVVGDWFKALVLEPLRIGFYDTINFLLRLFEGMANGWIRVFNAIVDSLNKIKVSIPSWVPGIGGKSFAVNLPYVPEITVPRLARGGVLKAGQIGFLEGSGAEAVVPLEKNTQWVSAVASLFAEEFSNFSLGDQIAKSIAEKGGNMSSKVELSDASIAKIANIFGEQLSAIMSSAARSTKTQKELRIDLDGRTLASGLFDYLIAEGVRLGKPIVG